MKNKRDEILTRMQSACTKSKRSLNEIRLLAVSKKQPIEKIEKMYELGQKLFAENYAQEFLEKKEKLNDKKIEWHLIGPLQTNKVSKVVGEAYLIHSVDSLKLAKILSEKSKEKSLKQNILLQINVSGENSKSGFSENEIAEFISEVLKLSNVNVLGLMTMPPFTENPEDSRKYFKKLKEISNKYGLKELSMGTTQDFEVAIEEGATIIRVGEALFGPRE